ncbi:hypothetical protein PRIPAC_88606 [Pristionchus pacificus]|uniref:Uncharacterized protein n=1 Tax=Pristionchus pacificus TaxID=54126 RepID=A0A2A6B5J5_PRIPA|nr:hypothetical protein PRIPAC_88606 [Pristionchus pacificus]|eukprot:PDM61147.1 hypothetical protein PRIPAC_50589 [Pristionchus pacificus]
MSFEVEMNLTILPSDVIRKLISVEDESLPSIRSISRRWNKLCMDHFTQRKQIPTIESVYFHRDLLDQKTIKICMKKKYLKYLETMKYRISCIPNTSDLIELSHRYPSDSSVFQGKLRFDVASIFKRCPNIERLEMSLGRIDCSERKAELLEIVGLSRNGSVKNLVFSRLDYFCVETAYVISPRWYQLAEEPLNNREQLLRYAKFVPFFKELSSSVPKIAVELSDPAIVLETKGGYGFWNRVANNLQRDNPVTVKMRTKNQH